TGPDLFQDLLPGHHLTGVLHEHAQQLELLVRQLHFPFVDQHSPSRQVQAHPGGLQGFRGPAAQQGSDAGHQFRQAERFGHVIVRSGVQAHDEINLIGAGGEHQHRQAAALGSQPPADLQAVHSREAQIEHQKIDPSGRRLAQRLRAVFNYPHRIALAFQSSGQRHGDSRVVLCQQHHAHIPSLDGGQDQIRHSSALAVGLIAPSARLLAVTADLELALQLADAADRITVERFRSRDLEVDRKPDRTPVTDADLAVEDAIREVLAEHRPEDTVAGEERGGSSDTGRVWVVDPIDGTKNVLRGVPAWATLIALVEDNRPLVGVVSAPALGKRWWAERGAGAHCSTGGGAAERISVSGVRELSDAYVSTTHLGTWVEHHSREAYLR